MTRLYAYDKTTMRLYPVEEDKMGAYCFVKDSNGVLTYVKLVPNVNGFIPNQRNLDLLLITCEEFEYHKNLLESINKVLKDS